MVCKRDNCSRCHFITPYAFWDETCQLSLVWNPIVQHFIWVHFGKIMQWNPKACWNHLGGSCTACMFALLQWQRHSENQNLFIWQKFVNFKNIYIQRKLRNLVVGVIRFTSFCWVKIAETHNLHHLPITFRHLIQRNYCLFSFVIRYRFLNKMILIKQLIDNSLY